MIFRMRVDCCLVNALNNIASFKIPFSKRLKIYSQKFNVSGLIESHFKYVLQLFSNILMSPDLTELVPFAYDNLKMNHIKLR